MKALLARIIGNSLPPRHSPTQAFRNLKYILENEVGNSFFDKVYIVNRIFDEVERSKIIGLLSETGSNYLEIPFNIEDYRSISIIDDIEWVERQVALNGYSKTMQDYPEKIRLIEEVAKNRSKIVYAMNNNGARNFVLNQYIRKYTWTMPLDGNCFFTREALALLENELMEFKHTENCVVLPMYRLGESLDPLVASPQDLKPCEPQVIFGCNAACTFDERRPYGRRPKVDLLKRLSVPGPWDHWEDMPWEIPTNTDENLKGRFYRSNSWVFRLRSGDDSQEVGSNSSLSRVDARNNAILHAIKRLDENVSTVCL
ncbi:hypothetical protein [Reinekea marinisedimentorum]|uniref:Uncharacterized protein n=1 Tax=Reinekea marinisedimentorum TaxID=230495 RepID=A0A4V2UIN7_9GAMM|nr:hypothetical protein [Reinekea marinisedimentorum]TCS36700.1 hypothetical protein BCF53_12322 [Reinekea marinisedimentorum]